MSRTAALTGATGFIGSALAHRMVKDGWILRVLARSSSRMAGLKDVPVQAVIGSLDDDTAVHDLVDNVDVVIHCAGAVRGATPQDFDRVNVEGVRHIVSSAGAQKAPPRFLLMSTLAAREPGLSPYASSKRRGEQTLMDTAGEMPWVIFRPPAVYGPGDRELLPLLQWVTRGIGLRLGDPAARFSLLFIDDLVEAVMSWIARPGVHNQILELEDGTMGYTWDQVFDLIAAMYGIRVRRIQIPGGLLHIVAWLNCLGARLLGFPPMLSPGKVRELRHADWICNNEQVSQVLDWAPRIPIQEGIRRTLSPYESSLRYAS